jgi:hypothetical protein
MPLHLIYNVPRDALDKNFKCWKVLAVPDRNSDHGHTAVADPHGTHQHGDCLEDGRMLVESVIETVLAADPPPYSEQGKTRGRKPKRDSAPGSKKGRVERNLERPRQEKPSKQARARKAKQHPLTLRLFQVMWKWGLPPVRMELAPPLPQRNQRNPGREKLRMQDMRP